jgi:hypothetical protein
VVIITILTTFIRVLTNRSVTLRLVTCFNHTGHYQVLNCYENVNVKYQKVEFIEVIDV